MHREVRTGRSVRDLSPSQATALKLDAAAVRVARRRGAIDLALGETLVRLFEGDRLLQLGYSKRVDYARERLGVPPRTLFLWVRLARGLSQRPLLRRAVVAGSVTPPKALAILPVAVEEDEGPWTAAAMTATLGDLEAAVRTAGKESPEACFEAQSLWLRMTAKQQDRLDAAIGLAQESLGYGAPRWQCLEAICQEWLGTFGAWVPEGGERRTAPADGDRLEETRKHAEAVDRQLRAVEEAVRVVDETADGDTSGDAHALDARARRLLAARRGFDEVFGGLAARIVRERPWRALGYRCLAEYCRERLGISPRSLRQRVWLERRMSALPQLRDALSSGRLTWSKALLVAKDATPGDVAERIEQATSTTWQQLERQSTEDEERRNRAAGVRRLWGPKDAAQTVAEAILSARALWQARGEVIGSGEALAVVADHFVEVWSQHLKRRWTGRDRREVLMRHRGLCAVPGCSRPATHEHHVRF
ncbi:MAG: hypothetical protein ACE5JG_10635, partial [Planctomycetota bacterium]